VEDQLRKGYIRPSKSPQTSPVFFVGKKNRSKQIVIDYRNLNDQTVKNNCPLPLITELIDNMGSKKVFNKMDLRWRFNNVRIKEEDEWKKAFTMHIGSFKPTVIFFGMTNLPAIFQVMINEGKVAVFIDNVLVGTKTEEVHNEIEAEKVKGVLSWPELKNVKDVRKFLGLANYYRRFIKDFARIARPMNMLTRKDERWW